jgi:hypothetical protein
MAYSTGALKSLGVAPFSCTTRWPVEMTVITASAFRLKVATRRRLSVPGGTTTVISSGSVRMFTTPGASCPSRGLAPELKTNASTGPRGLPTLMQPARAASTASQKRASLIHT